MKSARNDGALPACGTGEHREAGAGKSECALFERHPAINMIERCGEHFR